MGSVKNEEVMEICLGSKGYVSRGGYEIHTRLFIRSNVCKHYLKSMLIGNIRRWRDEDSTNCWP